MSDGDYPEAVHYLAAIEMAIEGAANNDSALEIIEEIIGVGPKCGEADLWPTRIIVNAIQQRGVRLEVPTA